jgi:GNAT superfamily N-acetyltransferase
MSDSNYALYLMEREGITLYERREGFLGYILYPKKMLITDLFIRPEYRGKTFSKHFMDKAYNIAKENNIRIICCTASPNALNFKNAERFILENNYKETMRDDSLVYYQKYLED